MFFLIKVVSPRWLNEDKMGKKNTTIFIKRCFSLGLKKIVDHAPDIENEESSERKLQI